MIRKVNFINLLVITVFILYLTELFRLTILFGLSLSTFAAIVTLTLIIYLIKNKVQLRFILRSKLIFPFYTFLFIIPLIFIPIHLYTGYMELGETIRVLGNNLLYVLLFLSSVIMGSKYKLEIIKKFIIIPSVFLATLGLLYNYINPILFMNLKLMIIGQDVLTDADSLSDIQRVGGFYLKSTYAATCIVPLFFFLFASRKSMSVKKIILILILISVVVFVTGSRSMIIFLVISLVFLKKLLKNYFIHGRHYAKRQASGLSNIVIFSISSIGLLALLYTSYSLENTEYSALGERILSLTSTESISDDQSLADRYGALSYYLNKTVENPIVGYGPVYMYNLIQKTDHLLSSHNSYIENIVRYGVFYIIFFFFMISRLWNSNSRHTFEIKYFMDYLGFIVIYILYSSFASSTIWENKVVLIVLGLGIGLAHIYVPSKPRKVK